MRLVTRTILTGAAMVLGAGCAERTTAPLSFSELQAALSTTPPGFESTSSSFSGNGAPMPGPGSAESRGPGPGRDFMGGGMHGDFLGGPNGGAFFEMKSTNASECTFSASTGFVTCGPTTREGLTILRTYQFKTADGTVQSKRDDLTNSASEHVEVSGTVTRRDNATATVKHTSDRTVVGLVKGSTQRTVNGSSSGSEKVTGTNKDGAAFTLSRTVSDNTSGLVIPITDGKPSYPTAGTVTREMNVSKTVSGTTTTFSRREVVTYDGSATAKLVITENGTTRNCTLPLPRGKPTCS